MEKEFVPYEIAEKLKSLGFNKPCFGRYYLHGTQKHISLFTDSNTDEISKRKSVKLICNAPLWQQVFDWIRDKHSIIYGIFDIRISTSTSSGYRFRYQFWKINQDDWIFEDESPLGSLTYEDARLECLNRILTEIEKVNVKN